MGKDIPDTKNRNKITASFVQYQREINSIFGPNGKHTNRFTFILDKTCSEPNCITSVA